MNSLVLSRINRQTPKSEKKSVVYVAPPAPIIEPIPSEELKKMIMEEFIEKPIAPVECLGSIKIFDGIEDFCFWYYILKDRFTEQQNIALTTLIQARDVINMGCACKKQARKAQSNQYFQEFWINNKNTDMVNVVKSIGPYSELDFRINGETFLKV